ncbi:hypothetical protein [Ferrimonas senticii]|nr:hypothetical protein [Ferrimonas senticii]
MQTRIVIAIVLTAACLTFALPTTAEVTHIAGTPWLGGTGTGQVS